jgi:hypothetical protein
MEYPSKRFICDGPSERLPTRLWCTAVYWRFLNFPKQEHPPDHASYPTLTAGDGGRQ